MTIRHLYPAVEPSLNLDFANSRKLDSRITFTRGSTATYTDESGIIRTAAANEARFDHDTDGNSLGLLIEESRTNLQINSEDLNSYTNVNVTWTTNNVVAPDGQTTADTPNTDNFPLILGVYVNGSFTGVNSSEVTTSWKRFSITFTPSSSQTIITYPLLNAGANIYTRGVAPTVSTTHTYSGFFKKVGSTIIPWGLQLEAGSFPTSYIPTSGSTVTRSADLASMTGTNFSSWYNQSEGTVVTKITDNGEPNTSNNRDIFYLGQGQSSGNNRIITTTGSVIGAYVQTTGAQVSITGGWYTKGVETVGAFAYKQDDSALATDGVVRGTANLGNLPTCNRLYLFMNRNQTNTLTGHFSRFTYYPVRLPDATLQALTL